MMKINIEHIYRCIRCGKEFTIPVTGVFHMLCTENMMKTDVLTDDCPSTHWCDKDKGEIGKLELIGFNVRK